MIGFESMIDREPYYQLEAIILDQLKWCHKYYNHIIAPIDSMSDNTLVIKLMNKVSELEPTSNITNCKTTYLNGESDNKLKGIIRTELDKIASGVVSAVEIPVAKISFVSSNKTIIPKIIDILLDNMKPLTFPIIHDIKIFVDPLHVYQHFGSFMEPSFDVEYKDQTYIIIVNLRIEINESTRKFIKLPSINTYEALNDDTHDIIE